MTLFGLLFVWVETSKTLLLICFQAEKTNGSIRATQEMNAHKDSKKC